MFVLIPGGARGRARIRGFDELADDRESGEAGAPFDREHTEDVVGAVSGVTSDGYHQPGAWGSVGGSVVVHAGPDVEVASRRTLNCGASLACGAGDPRGERRHRASPQSELEVRGFSVLNDVEVFVSVGSSDAFGAGVNEDAASHADVGADASPSRARPRVLMADDHTLVREGLMRLLAAELEIVGAVADGRALVSAAEQCQPDVVLVDVTMPLLNGFDAARQLQRACPRGRIIFVTVHAEPDYVQEAFRAGAHGYVVKTAASSELLLAVRRVLAGGTFVSPGLVYEPRPGAPEEGLAGGELSSRQREVLQLVAEGRPAREIGDILGISRKTVEFHKARLMRVLGLRTVAELTRYAVEHGLLPGR
ncbi:response regulator transcription factor [Nannocystis sp. RBIL2]|nr:response regulator transcription factor [Nannocystis sp. RBIL2]MCY1069270.1 response regulator transcription factor [Nannocystis sp. RBIL2]